MKNHRSIDPAPGRFADEGDRRRVDWVEGEWLVLADGQRWCFAPPESVPDYAEESEIASRRVVDLFIMLINSRTIRNENRLISLDDPASSIRALACTFTLCRIVLWAGIKLLRRNYRITDAECERLMPFNFGIGDLDDPRALFYRAGPESFAICSRVAGVSGIDIRAKLSRIASSN
ncbi:hypothetical protein [Singulisphaera sp. PoT]|uniref:hypothetical protein n=1 Tax=Singulisphaera sp. PoT TaxID=3411797 RepID=UPI003BF5C164